MTPADITISLAVIVCAGVLVGILLLTTKNKRKKRERELADYCRARGYVIGSVVGSLGTELHIEGDAFSLMSRMVSPRDEASAGSRSWEMETVWTARGEDVTRPCFMLGAVTAAGSWESMPEWMKTAVLNKLAAETGAAFDPGRTRLIHTSGRRGYLLFEEKPGESLALVERLKPLLEAWSNDLNLVISGSPRAVSIRAAGLFIRDTTRLESVLKLGGVFTAERRESAPVCSAAEQS